jgi:predicted hydrocarbon binding protein
VGRDLVYVVHPEPAVAAKLSGGLEAMDYEVVGMSTVEEAEAITGSRHFVIPDAILTPLGDIESGDSVLIALFQSSPLMEQIPLVVVASSGKDERRRALRMGMLSMVFPPYDDEEVALTNKLAIENHRSDQLLFGSLEQLSVPELLQTAEAGRRTGTVIFQHDGEKGTVWMRDGFVIDAEVEGDCSGEEAVYRIAVWTKGTFEADFGDLDMEGQFTIPPSTLLLEAMRRFDEESASTMPIPAMEATDTEVLDLSLVLLNVIAGYALNHLNATLILERIERTRERLCDEHPELTIFRITDEGTITLQGENPLPVDEQKLAAAVGVLVVSVFEELDAALAWRFTTQRLARLVAPWREKLDSHGFMEGLDVEERDEAPDEDSHDAPGIGGKPVPVGCLVIDGEGVIEAYSAFGPRIGRIEPTVVVGRALAEVLPPQLASLTDRLMGRLIDGAGSTEGLAIGREVMRAGHQENVVRVAVVQTASKAGFVITFNRLRDQRRSLSPEIERDPVTGSLRDGNVDRLLVANEDFLQAFEGLFAKSLRHRHHELLQRFGKKWGLRHAMRLENVVQRDYRMTLREMESQMALELMSSSVGVFGLGKFEADLGYRDRGLIIIRHQASPFPGIFESTAGGACSILSGFHAAILSYLAGRNLAAREVQCAHEPGDPCVFVIATEDRLTTLLIATPGSADHDLLQEIIRNEPGGES